MLQKLDSRGVTREVLGALCIFPGIIKNGRKKPSEIRIGSTGLMLHQLVDQDVIDVVCEHARRMKGDIQIAPHCNCTERRLVILIKVGDKLNTTYFRAYNGDVISGAPDFSAFRPKPSESDHEVYRHHRIRQERGFLSRRR